MYIELIWDFQYFTKILLLGLVRKLEADQRRKTRNSKGQSPFQFATDKENEEEHWSYLLTWFSFVDQYKKKVASSFKLKKIALTA
jgi:hypothetical protein